MSVLESVLPTVVAGAVVVFFALRAVLVSNRADRAHRLDIARRRAELDRRVAEIHRAADAPGAELPDHPLELRVELELTDREAVPDVALATKSYGPLIEQFREIDVSLGGRGMAVTGIHADPGVVELTFTVPDAIDASARIGRVAERINAVGYALPPGVAAARALPV